MPRRKITYYVLLIITYRQAIKSTIDAYGSGLDFWQNVNRDVWQFLKHIPLLEAL